MVRLARLRFVVSIVAVLCLPALAARAQTVSDLVAGPPNLQLSLAPSDTAIRAVTLVNSADTAVSFRVRISPGGPIAARAFPSRVRGPLEWPDARSDRRPERMRVPELSRRTAPVLQAGADVLLLQDALPWGTSSNEQVLQANGIAFDVANSAVLPGFDLSPYALVIVASDQPTSFYDAIAADSAAIEAWVANGGTLEFHAAGWGFQGGDASRVTLPGGMHIFPRSAPFNHVEIPSHPIVFGVPTLLTGTSASHASFSAVPSGASVIVTDDIGNPNLVEYFHGSGLVIACGQTLEFGYAQGQDAGRILANLIPYAHSDVVSWLDVGPMHGEVPAHGTLDLSMRFQSGGPAGDFYASVVLEGVDPDTTRLNIPVTLTVAAVPNAQLLGPSRHSTSQKTYTQYSETTHHALVVQEPHGSQATLTLNVDGDFGDISEFAQLTVEGASVGTVGEVGGDCLPAVGEFPLTLALPDSVFDDGALDATVTNSPNVDLFCAVNRHTLELHYFLRADSIGFGEVVLTSCAAETLTLRNSGNVALHVSSITCDAPFAVSPADAVLLPDSSVAIVVSICAATEGDFSGALSIASDDPDTPLLASIVTAHGVTPAAIVVQPDSMSAGLYTGGTEVQELHLHNGGGATLRGTLTAVAAYPAKKHPALDTPALPIVLVDPAGDASGVDLLRVRAASNGTELRIVLEMAAAVDSSQIGGFVSLDVDQNRLTGRAPLSGLPAHDIGAEYEIGLSTLLFGYVEVYPPTGGVVQTYPAAISGNTVEFAVLLSGLGGDDGNVDFTGSMSNGISTTDYFPNAGHGTIQDVRWLRLPGPFEIPSGGDLTLPVTFDAAGLGSGIHRGEIHVLSNDPLDPEHVVAARLEVTGASHIQVFPESLAFQTLFLGATQVLPVSIANQGTLALHAVLTIGPVRGDPWPYTVDTPTIDLAPGQQQQVHVRFAPTVAGSFTPLLQIVSNDPDDALHSVGLSGIGVEAPDLSLGPDSLHVGLESGSAYDRTITIENHGGSPLEWQLSLEESPVSANAHARSAAGHGNVSHGGPVETSTARFDPGHTEFAAKAPDLAGMPPWVLPASLGVRSGASAPSGPGLAADSTSFEDDFEDGDISDWLFAAPTPFEVVTDVAAHGTHSLHQFASFGGHVSGRYHPLAPSQPERIRFDVRLANTTDAAGYVLFFDEYGNVPILFLATPTGKLSINLFTGQGDSSLAFTPGLWYRIELRNLDYAARTFDYFVNGALVKAGVPLATSTLQARLVEVHLYSWTPGAEAWWDDLRIGGGHVPEWLSANTTAGSVAPGEQAVVTLHFNAAGLIEGAYGAHVVVDTNDPTAGSDSVNVRLDVDGTQRLTMRGVRHEVVSSQAYFNDGGTTVHHLPVPTNATGSAEFGLIANGDYGDPSEHATLTVEGTTLGSVGAVGPDCIPAAAQFDVRDSLFEAWAGADGELTALVTNDLDVNVQCPVNQHQVSVAWHDAPDTTDFGPVFLSACRSETLEVFNSGTAVLTVSSFATDHADFTVTPSQVLLAPFQRAPVFVTYCPGSLGAAEAGLTVLSDDPDHGTVTLLLRGSGIPAPVLEVSPDSIVADLLIGTILDTAITISNTGGHDLSVALEVRPAGGDSIAVHPSRAPIAASGMPWKSPEAPAEARAARRSLPILRARPGNVVHTLPLVLTDPAGDAGNPDLVAVRAALLSDSLQFEMEFTLPVDPYNLGGGISFDLDRNVLTGPPPYFGNGGQVLGSEMTVFLFDVENSIVPVYDAFGNTLLGFGKAWVSGNRVGFALPRFLLGSSTNFDFAGTVGNAGGPTDFFPDAGHGSLLGTAWLSVAPETLVVPPGESREVTVTLDGNLVVAGNYEANIHVMSDDPLHPTADVPVRARVYGIPDLLAPSAVSFDSVVAGTTARRPIWLINTGTDVLDVSDVSSNDFQFAATPTAFSIVRGESLEVEISCVPSGTGPRSGVVTIHSNDPDDSTHVIDLFVIGTPPPSATFSLTSLEQTLHEGETAEVPLTLRNDGEGPLHWSARVTFGDTGFVVRHVAAAASPGGPHAKDAARTEPVLSAARPASPAVRVASARRTGQSLPLEDVQVAIAAHFDSLTSLIPSRFDFAEGETGTTISDGGGDMYDGGNQLSTELGFPLPYDSLITTHVGLPGGRYFTLKRPGLFVFAADVGVVNEFYVSGNLGADGGGQVDVSELVVNHGAIVWRGFVKRVFNAGDPSVNHLIVVADQPGLAHDYSTSTDSDLDRVSGLFGASRVTYLLFSSQNGGYVNDSVMLQMMERLIEITEKSWLLVSPEAGIVMPSDSTQITVSLDVSGLAAGDHHGAIHFDTDDPEHLVFTLPVLLHADTTVAASRSLMESSVGPGLVRLAWWSSDRSGFTARVERREEAGAWESVGEILTDGSGVARFEDRDVLGGATYHYRIHVRGEPEPDGEVIVTVPMAFAFALSGAHPNPATPDLRVAFTLPDGAPASLELLDLAGRRVVSREVGSLGAGRHLVALGRERVLADGLYWVRLKRAGEQKIAKVVIHR